MPRRAAKKDSSPRIVALIRFASLLFLRAAGAQLTLDIAGMLNTDGGKQAGQLLGAFADLLLNAGGGDDCPRYECSDGSRPKQNPAYEPVGNGCGTDLIKVESKYKDLFSTCCDGHDICYMTCGKTHKGCEEEFKHCLEETCTSLSRTERDECTTESKVYRVGTSSFGCAFFSNAQKDACVCEGGATPLLAEL